MREASRATLVGSLVFLAACKHSEPAAPALDAGAAPVVAELASDGGAIAARCALVEGAGTTLPDVGDRRALDVGDGAADEGGVAVGVVHSPAGGAEALIARVAGGRLQKTWVVARGGELVPDAPPPRGFFVGGTLYGAFVVRDGAADASVGGARRLVVKSEGAAAALASFPDRSVESLAFDVAVSADASRAAVVWDADGNLGGSSGITVGIATLKGGAVPVARVVSADTVDPDAPRVAPRVAGGWWVAWTAHRPEAAADAGGGVASASIESAADVPSYSWIEIVALAEDGAPLAPPRRITSATGHVASFDVLARARGSLEVVARDEAQLRDDEGGRILRVVVPGDGGADESSIVVPSGAGRGSVDLLAVPSGDPWLAFTDLQDHARVVPLAPPRASAALSGPEIALDGGRLIAFAGGAPDAQNVRFLAAFPGVEGDLFRLATCTP